MEGMPSVEQMQMQQQQKAAMEEQRASILDQILEAGAKDRLKRLALVKPDKARAVEDSLVVAATSGKLKSKVTEEQLIAMLEGGPSGSGGASKVKIQRRNYGFDDDDDDDDDI